MRSHKLKACDKHPPFPQGICTECDPGSVRLNAQRYRHVDSIVFESKEIVGDFLRGRYDTKQQRCGFLYGKYEVLERIPLGVKACVSAIYEPPQQEHEGQARLKADALEEQVESIAHKLGLQRIGFIWTDYFFDSAGKPKTERQDFTPNAAEIIRMGKMQHAFPAPFKQAHDGYFGSKFVSVMVVAEDSNITPKGFQVSNQCTSLVRDGVIASTSDQSRIRLRKVGPDTFLPSVVYMDKRDNADVLVTANPHMPKDFFIIPLPATTPVHPIQTFFRHTTFPIENRISSSSSSQKLQLRRDLLDKPHANSITSALRDFHLLVYLASIISESEMQSVIDHLNSATSKDIQELKQFFSQLLHDVPNSSSQTTGSSNNTNSSNNNQTSSSNRPPHPKENELMSALLEMGYEFDQAKQAIVATNYRGIEEAINFLVTQ